MTISPFKWQTTALTVAGLGSCSALAGILQYTLFFGMSQALQKCRLFCVNHLEVIVEEEENKIKYTYSQSEEWIKEVEDLKVRLAPWGPWDTQQDILTLELVILRQRYPEFDAWCEFYDLMYGLSNDPDNDWLLDRIARKYLTKNQIFTSAGARIYYGGLAKALQDYQNELLRSPEAYVRSEEEWWLDAEAKPALLHLISDPDFEEWLDDPTGEKTQKKVKRKVVEDLTAKLKPYSGKIQKTDEIGKYTIDREKEISDTKLENIGESTVDSAFDFTYGYPKNKVRRLAQGLLKLSEFDRRLVLTEHGQAGKNSMWKKNNTIKVLSEESGISESALRQRKKRDIDFLKEYVTNDES